MVKSNDRLTVQFVSEKWSRGNYRLVQTASGLLVPTSEPHQTSGNATQQQVISLTHVTRAVMSLSTGEHSATYINILLKLMQLDYSATTAAFACVIYLVNHKLPAVYRYTPLYTDTYRCIPTHTTVYPHIPMHTTPCNNYCTTADHFCSTIPDTHWQYNLVQIPKQKKT